MSPHRRKTVRRSRSLAIDVQPLESRLVLSASKAAPAGTLTLAYESAVQNLVSTEIATYESIGSNPTTAANVAPLVNDLSQTSALLSGEQAVIRPLVSGKVKSVVLGGSGRSKVVLDKNALAAIDTIVAKAVTAQANVEGVSLGQVSIRSLVHEEKTSGRVSVPSDLVPYVAPVVNFLTNTAPATTIQVGSAVRNVFTTLAGGQRTPTGEAVFVGITQVTAGIAGGIEAGSKSIISNNLDLSVSNQNLTATFLADSYSDGAYSKLVNEIQGLKNFLGSLGTTVSQLSTTVADVAAQNNPFVPGSVAAQADTSIELANTPPAPVDPTPVDPTPVDPTPVDPTPVDPTPIPTPILTDPPVTSVPTPDPTDPISSPTVNPPVIGVSTTELYGTIAQGTGDVTGSFTVSNIGGGTVAPVVASDTGRIEFSTSEAGNVLTVSIEATTSDLPAGSYHLGSVTISDGNGVAIPHAVSIDIVVEPSSGGSGNSGDSDGLGNGNGSGESGNSGGTDGSTISYLVQYRFPDDPPGQFNFATTNYPTSSQALADFQQTLQIDQQSDSDGSDPNGVPSEYQLLEYSSDTGEYTVLQDVNL